MSWRAGAKLFREAWPSIQSSIPESEVRHDFVRDFLDLLAKYDVDPTDLRRLHPEVDKLLDERGTSLG